MTQDLQAKVVRQLLEGQSKRCNPQCTKRPHTVTIQMNDVEWERFRDLVVSEGFSSYSEWVRYVLHRDWSAFDKERKTDSYRAYQIARWQEEADK